MKFPLARPFHSTVSQLAAGLPFANICALRRTVEASLPKPKVESATGGGKTQNTVAAAVPALKVEPSTLKLRKVKVTGAGSTITAEVELTLKEAVDFGSILIRGTAKTELGTLDTALFTTLAKAPAEVKVPTISVTLPVSSVSLNPKDVQAMVEGRGAEEILALKRVVIDAMGGSKAAGSLALDAKFDVSVGTDGVFVTAEPKSAEAILRYRISQLAPKSLAAIDKALTDSLVSNA